MYAAPGGWDHAHTLDVESVVNSALKAQGSGMGCVCWCLKLDVTPVWSVLTREMYSDG